MSTPDENFIVSQREIVHRGLRNRCPNCGGKTLFERGLTMHRNCPQCGMKFERDDGFFLGAATLNYVAALFVGLLPILILFLAGVLSVSAATALGIIAAIGFPVLFYRTSRSWWLMAYFYFLPHELPANRKNASPFEDDA